MAPPHPSITLPYPARAMHYPSVRRAPPAVYVLVPLLCILMCIGFALLAAPFNGLVPGCVALALSGGTVLYLMLLYAPVSTWLCLSTEGITYTVVFWRREFPWSRVRELRVIYADGPFCGDLLVEVVMDGVGKERRLRPTIPARLLGWPPEALVEEMYDWRSRHVRG
jgi:hypothetical protein